MQGDIWVESELGKGSKFYFTITSQTNQQQSLDTTLMKLSPFTKRTILFVDTMHDSSDVEDRITELGLVPVVVHDVSEVADKEKCPHIDTIIVDSLPVVCPVFLFPNLDTHYLFSRRKVCASTNIFATSLLLCWLLHCPVSIVRVLPSSI
jgi:osomolarity two-component system sensor histidine kinase NIK1